MLMRLFSSSDKHSFQKIRSQHLIQINLVAQSDIVNSEDMQAISIANNKIQREILLFNIYNEKSQNANDEQVYTIERELAKVMLNSEQKVIIVEDFNAHHS